MKYNFLGRTGLYVSEICLGTMTWGGKGFWTVVGQLPLEAVTSQLRVAVESGVNFIDTANVYSEGLSEELLGQAIRALGIDRRELIVATKVRGRMGPGRNEVGLSRHAIMNGIDASLRRLQMDHVDLYQIHGVDPLTPIDETLRALDDLVRSGKVRYIGLSNHAAWQIMKANALAERHGWTRFESVQAYYSLAGRDLEREILPLVHDQSMGVMVWSPLAGGLLSGKFSRDASGPDGARRSTFDFPPVNRERAWACIDAMRPIAEARGVSAARVALAWVLAQRGVTTIIIGAKSEEQLRDNIAASDLTLTVEEFRALDAVSALPPEYPAWMFAMQGGDRG
jgi:aryl-alcohol dehydrogenase-like predicted oxidoreductase